MNVFIKKSKANNATKDNEFRKYKSTESMKMFWKLCTKNTGE